MRDGVNRYIFKAKQRWLKGGKRMVRKKRQDPTVVKLIFAVDVQMLRKRMEDSAKSFPSSQLSPLPLHTTPSPSTQHLYSQPFSISKSTTLLNHDPFTYKTDVLILEQT